MKKNVNYNLPYKSSNITVFGIGPPSFPKCLGHFANSVYVQVSTTMSTVRLGPAQGAKEARPHVILAHAA